MDSNALQVFKLDEDAKLPVRQTSGSAGYDLYSLDAGIVEPRSRLLVSTGISIKLPPNTYGRIASRSGLSVRDGIEVGAGVIDSDYSGNIGILLHNFTDKPYEFDEYTRIAQLIITPVLTPVVEEIDSEVFNLIAKEKNSRNGKGFGSTGITG